MTRSIPDDTRGILSPAGLVEHVDFERFAPPDDLRGLVDWFWSVRWDLAPGVVHRQRLLPQPAVNISMGNAPPPGEDPPPGPHALRTVINGVPTGSSARVLSGSGWTVAAKTTTGGFGAWVDDVHLLTDRVAPAAEVLGVDDTHLAVAATALAPQSAAQLLAHTLLNLLDRRPRAALARAREVAEVAKAAESDRTIRRVEQLAALAGTTSRTLQRTFLRCAGVSPTWVIRRFRLIDAAERVRTGAAMDWAQLAIELGYADQAHLVREFTGTIGRPPGVYARECRALPSTGARARRAARAEGG